jgi:hypothetical protein
MSTDNRGLVFAVVGIVCLALAVLMSVAGMVIFLSGNEVALLLMIVGFGVFVTSIGLLAAARTSRSAR